MSRVRRGKRKRDPLPAGQLGELKLVAIVGRPNVGKSTLFNRLAGRHIAIVEDIPGVTRDRQYADADALGRPFVLIDTGGFDPESDDPMKHSIGEQVELAIEEADLIICVLDATTEPMPADRTAVELLRRAKTPIIYVANKADSDRQSQAGMGHYELGLDNLTMISALHGRGMGSLEDDIAAHLPEGMSEADLDAHYSAPRVAIIGRPNAGKSSLVNHLLGEERLVVNDRPGTTMDSVDTWLERDGNPLVLIDTAGMRRRSTVKKVRGIEGLAVLRAVKSIERSHAVALMIDGDRGVAEQDVKIATLARDRGRAMAIGLNKTDLLDSERREIAITRARELLYMVPWATIVPMSVKNGRGVKKLMAAIDAGLVQHNKRIPTGELNRFFETVLLTHPPPTMNKRNVRLFYITQAEVRPPTFVIIANQPDDVRESYQAYVVNQIRKHFGFHGSAIRVKYRKRSRKEKD